MSAKEPEHEFEAGDVLWDDTLKSDLLQCKVCQLPASAKVHGHAIVTEGIPAPAAQPELAVAEAIRPEEQPALFEEGCAPVSEDKLLYRIEMAYGAAERGQFFDCEKWLGEAIVASQEKRQAIREAEAKASGKIP